MNRSVRMITSVVALGTSLLLGSSAAGQSCAATDIGGRTTCDNEGAACSPPTGGSCNTTSSGCLCRGKPTLQQQKCQQAIGKAGVKFASTKLKTDEQCDDALVKTGACDVNAALNKISASANQAGLMIQSACNGVDLTGLSPGGCAVQANGTPNQLPDVISCILGGHFQGTSILTQNQYGGAELIRCCVNGVCTKTNPANCTGTNKGSGSCIPDPC